MKVRYSIFIKHDQTTIHNVDSIVVIQSYNEYMDFGDDNYSWLNIKLDKAWTRII